MKIVSNFSEMNSLSFESGKTTLHNSYSYLFKVHVTYRFFRQTDWEEVMNLLTLKSYLKWSYVIRKPVFGVPAYS